MKMGPLQLITIVAAVLCLTGPVSSHGIEQFNEVRVPSELLLDTAQRISLAGNYVTQWLQDSTTGFVATRGSGLHGHCVLLRTPVTSSVGTEDALFRQVLEDTFIVQTVRDVAAMAGESVAAFCGDLQTVTLVRSTGRTKRGQTCFCVNVCNNGVCTCQFTCINIG